MLRWLLLSAVLIGCSSQPKVPEALPTPPPTPQTVEEAVNSTTFRTETNRARDVYRHPVETLNFFGLKPNMTVIEITPGAGWYQEILAPLLVQQGHYIAAMPPASAKEGNGGTPQILKWQQEHSEIAAKITTVELNPQAPLASPESADMILTFRNVHNWMATGDAQAVFNSFFAALKPGGVLGVVEHRANPHKRRDPKAKSGYVLEKDVIAMAKKAGFKLDAKSEINANPKDTKNYPEGVWTLPPVLRLKDKDRARYLAIGESDRMTLRFIKPAH